MSQLLTPEELAELIRVRVGTLAAWRNRRQGPAYVRVGDLIRYPADAVEAWVSKTRVQAA